jgi:hypothetical protein
MVNMKFFPDNLAIDQKIDFLMKKFRKLMDGEISGLMTTSGAVYRKNYGVSLVHLRKLASELDKNADLAIRLWYREIRESMIMATLLADFDQLGAGELDQWGEMVHTLELSEQLGRNLLSQTVVPESFLSGWLNSDHFYKQYAAAMGIGWRLRLRPEVGFHALDEIIPRLKILSGQPQFMRAGAFLLKMAGRFSDAHRSLILLVVGDWMQDDNSSVKQIGDDVKYELDV